jgi:hypothetical protein
LPHFEASSAAERSLPSLLSAITNGSDSGLAFQKDQIAWPPRWRDNHDPACYFRRESENRGDKYILKLLVFCWLTDFPPK